MSTTLTTHCSLCGTVNVGLPTHCIACGQELGQDLESQEAPVPHGDDLPLSQTGEIAIEPGAVDEDEAAAAAPRVDDLDQSARRRTVVEMPEEALRRHVAARAKQAAAEAGGADGGAGAPSAGTGARFTLRLLLPEGDRRKVDVGSRPVVLGSGLDELGLPGDPRVAAGEAKVFVEGGRLFVEPCEGATSVYLRVEGERPLDEGDHVLVGDIAAEFRKLDPGPPVDGSRQVLGGGANAPCGRLVFLRRDGTPGPVHDLPAGKTVVGRTDGHLNFPNDSRLSRRHVRFFASDRGVTVEDLDSRNGTYLRVRRRTELKVGDALRVGSAGVQVRGSA